jgi:hypothetical protein
MSLNDIACTPRSRCIAAPRAVGRTGRQTSSMLHICAFDLRILPGDIRRPRVVRPSPDPDMRTRVRHSLQTLRRRFLKSRALCAERGERLVGSTSTLFPHHDSPRRCGRHTPYRCAECMGAHADMLTARQGAGSTQCFLPSRSPSCGSTCSASAVTRGLYACCLRSWSPSTRPRPRTRVQWCTWCAQHSLSNIDPLTPKISTA